MFASRTGRFGSTTAGSAAPTSLLRSFLTMALVVVASFTLSSVLAARADAALTTSPLPGSTFQGADGNQADPDGAGTLTDWQNYAGTATTVLDAPLPTGVGNDTFYSGKINEPNTWVLDAVSGGVTPGKANALASSVLLDPLTQDTFFYFSFIRESDSNAETHYSLELRKLTTTWVNDQGTTIPCRSNGDLLLFFNVDPSAKNVTFTAFRWTSTSPGPAECPEGKVGTYTEVDLGSNVQGHMNFGGVGQPGDITNYLRTDVFGNTLDEGTFGEGAINLTNTIGTGSNPCFSFGEAQFFSLSSGESFSSAMQDMITPAPIQVRNCSASGTKWRDDNADGVRQQGEPGLAGWTFWVDYDDDGVIDAGEPSGVSGPTGAYTITGINPAGAGFPANASYKIHEQAPNGVTGYTCTYPNALTPNGGVDLHGCFWSATFATTGNQTGFDFGNAPPADLSVVKTPDGQTVDAGDPISFTMVTSNAGLGTAKGVTLVDNLPAGVDWSITAQTNPGECSITGAVNSEVLNCTYGDLAGGQTRSVTVGAQTSFTACGTYDNTATVDGTNTPPDTDTGLITCRKPSLTEVKTPNDQTVDAGDPISFTMVTANGGPGTARSVTLSDPLPAGVDWSITAQTNPGECSITGAIGSEVLNCSYGDLVSGQSRSVTVLAQTSFNACGVYDNTATAKASNAPDASDAGKITCKAPSLTEVKTPNDQTVDAGDPISFTMVTANGAGAGTAKGVTLSDPLPAGVDWSITAQTNVGECSITGAVGSEVLSCTYGDLSAGESRSVTVSAQTSFTACGVYDNEATASADNAPDADDEGKITCRAPSLTEVKTPNDQTVDAGDAISFTVVTANGGPGTAKNVTVSDPLPAGVDWSISAQTNPGECSISGAVGSEVLSCSYGDLASGQSRSVTVSAQTSFSACGVYDNEATASADNAPDADDEGKITCKAPSLTEVKTPNDQTVNAGDPISFTMVTANGTGAGTAKNVTLSDPLPAGVDWSISAQTNVGECSITGAVGSEVLSCDYGDLSAGESRSVTVGAQTSFAACGVYDNTATASADNAPDADDDGKISCDAPNLTETKTPNDQTVDAGDPISFTVVTGNTGTGTAKNVTVSDPLPAGVDWSISAQTNPGECSISGAVGSEVLSCSYGDLATGQSRSVTVSAQTSFNACGVYDNEATASADNAPDASDEGKITCRAPTLTETKTPNDQTVDAGDAIAFTVVTANGGPGTAKNVTVSDPLPAGVDWSISAQTNVGECSIAGAVGSEVLSCDYGDLVAGQSRSVTVGAQTSYTDCTVYDNTATASADNAPDASDAGKITCKRPTLGEDKAALQVSVDAGDDISFVMTTSNTGEGTAKGVMLNDPLPDGVNWSISSQTNAGECSITGAGNDQVLACDYGDLAPGASRQVTVTATTSFEACAVYDNTATASAANAPSDSDDASVACKKPSVSIEKTTSTGTINAGDVAKFTVKVSNGGPGTAKNVVISDPLPAGPTWSFDGAAPAGCVLADQKVTCTLAAFAPGSFTFNVQATTTQENCAVYDNTATGTGSNTGPIAPDSASITCRKLPAISIDKTGPATAIAGDRVTYSLAVKNTGPTAFAEGMVIVTDALCEAPPALVGKGDDGSPATLDPNDTWFYTCTVQTQVGQTVVNNVGVVNGTDVNGNKASAQDPADTVLSQPVVLGVSVPPPAVVPGAAKLRGPSGCLLKPTTKVYVTGKQILSVRFVLDKKTLKTVYRADKQGRYGTTIVRKNAKLGTHLVRAIVTFRAASQTKPRTLQLRFSRCGEVKPARAKGFTG